MQLPPFKHGGLHMGLQSGTVDHSTFPGVQVPFLQNMFATVDESGNWYPSMQLIVHALKFSNKLVSSQYKIENFPHSELHFFFEFIGVLGKPWQYRGMLKC